MSFLNNIKPNVPQAKLEGYFFAMHGKSKFGKTTLWADIIRKHYNGDMSKGLLIATEKGYKALDGIHAIRVTDFDEVDQDDVHTEEGQYGFIQLVDELIEEKANIPYRLLIIDTITALERYATSYVLKKQSRKDKVRYNDITDIEWGKGYNLLAEEIYSQIERLIDNEFGVVVIGHSKTKNVKQRDGLEFEYTGFNVQNKTSDIIEREADVIMYGDITISRKSKKEKGVISERTLKFRSDGDILCGSRFDDFPAEMEVDAQTFLDAFAKGVESARSSKSVAKKDVVENIEEEVEDDTSKAKPKTKVKTKAKTKTKAKPDIEEEVEVEEVVEDASNESESDEKESKYVPEELHAQISEAIAEADLSQADKKDLVHEFKALGIPKGNFTLTEDIETLEQALEIVREF